MVDKTPSNSQDDEEVSFNLESDFTEWDHSSYEHAKDQSQDKSKSKRKSKSTKFIYFSDESNESLYKICWQRADRYVQQFIKEQDAANCKRKKKTKKSKNKASKKNQFPKAEAESKTHKVATSGQNNEHLQSVDKISKEEHHGLSRESKESQNNENLQFVDKLSIEEGRDSSRASKESKHFGKFEAPTKQKSDTESSQLSQTSSDESKTYSQVYSEIYEESKARQEKADEICRVYTSKSKAELQQKSCYKDRTERWVENLDQQDIDGSATEASYEDDKESDYYYPAGSPSELDCEALIKEQEDTIKGYYNDPIGSFRSCIKEYAYELGEVLNEQKKQKRKCRQTKNYPKESVSQDTQKYSEDVTADISIQSEDLSNESYAQDLGLKKESSPGSPKLKGLIENEPEKSRVEIIEFEHCVIYHIKQTEAIKSYLKVDQVHSPIEADSPGGSKHSITQGYQRTAVIDIYDKETSDCSYQSEGKCFEISVKNREERKCRRTINRENSDGSGQSVSDSLDGARRTKSKERPSNNNHKSSQKAENREILYSDKQKQSNMFEDSSNQIEELDFYIINSSETSSHNSHESFQRNCNIMGASEGNFKGSSNNIEERKFGNSKHRIHESETSSNNSHKSERSSKRNSRSDEQTNALQDIEKRRAQRNRYLHDSSENSSSNSHKSHRSLKVTRRESTKGSSSNSDCCSVKSFNKSLACAEDIIDSNYLCNNSLSTSISQISSFRLQGAIDKTYEDRASSPIEIKSSSSFKKNELQIECSQTSISSGDKAVQYPSEDELEETQKTQNIKFTNVSCPKIYDLDKAKLGLPTVFKGKAIMFDHEDELLDITLTDNEMQIQAKLQAAVGSGRKKDGSINSSLYSTPSEYRSYNGSICSHQPSVRFYRRTQPDDDISDYLPWKNESSVPMSYKQHVARLAQQTLQASCNSHNEGIKLKPKLEQEISNKVEQLYNSEVQFQGSQRQSTHEVLLQQFNERLRRQLKLIAPKFQGA